MLYMNRGIHKILRYMNCWWFMMANGFSSRFCFLLSNEDRNSHLVFWTGVCIGHYNERFFIVLNFYMALSMACKYVPSLPLPGGNFTAENLWDASSFDHVSFVVGYFPHFFHKPCSNFCCLQVLVWLCTL